MYYSSKAKLHMIVISKKTHVVQRPLVMHIFELNRHKVRFPVIWRGRSGSSPSSTMLQFAKELLSQIKLLCYQGLSLMLHLALSFHLLFRLLGLRVDSNLLQVLLQVDRFRKCLQGRVHKVNYVHMTKPHFTTELKKKKLALKYNF